MPKPASRASRSAASPSAPASATPPRRTTSPTPAACFTALAAEGFARLLATQLRREAAAAPGQPDRLVAAGLGYIAFATTHPALFRLIFASDRPDRDAPALREAADAAYRHLLDNVAELRGIADAASDPAAMTDATAAWGIVHGIADLLQAGRMPHLRALPAPERDAVLAGIIRRALAR